MTYQPAPILEEAKKRLIASGYNPSEVTGAMVDVQAQLEMQYSLGGAVRQCTACQLRASCTGHPVPGMGPITSPLMIVGESPGVDDVRLGAPFVGSTGQIVTIILNKLGIHRKHLYITNIVKCHTTSELQYEDTLECFHHFANEVAAVMPKVILTMGNIPLRILANDPDLKIGQVRGKMFNEQVSVYGIPVIPTFNPGYLNHHQGAQLTALKKQMWVDIEQALQIAGLKQPMGVTP